MMPDAYILSKLDKLRSTENSVANFNSPNELRDYIVKVIMSKKFRKFSVVPEYQAHIKKVVEESIKENLPIKFSFPFGGYKLWRLEETPEADWAELFTLMYYSKWLKPITEVYKPGILFDFSSDDVIVERMNNVPKSDTQKYAASFNNIIDFLKKYIPNNMKFTLTPISSLYTPEEFEIDLQDKIDKMQKELGGLPVLDEHKKRMTEMNVKLKPHQDDDILWKEKVELLHQAYYVVDRRRPYNRAEDKILTFCTKLKDGKCISVGTTKSSVAKFWVGVGVLKRSGSDFVEYVLSPSQLEAANIKEEPISIDGLNGKNFSKIKIS